MARQSTRRYRKSKLQEALKPPIERRRACSYILQGIFPGNRQPLDAKRSFQIHCLIQLRQFLFEHLHSGHFALGYAIANARSMEKILVRSVNLISTIAAGSNTWSTWPLHLF